jgi:hypothetical protein
VVHGILQKNVDSWSNEDGDMEAGFEVESAILFLGVGVIRHAVMKGGGGCIMEVWRQVSGWRDGSDYASTGALR